MGHASRSPPHFRQIRAPVIQLGRDELDSGADAGERIADLVGHVGRELPQRYQPVDLLLELAALGLGHGVGHQNVAGHSAGLPT